MAGVVVGVGEGLVEVGEETGNSPSGGGVAFDLAVPQGSLAGGLWELYDDPVGDHRFRVALFFAVACANPAACP